VKSELDVLQARQQLYSALRDLQKARYEMITSRIKLKAAAGRLDDADLTAFDKWFVQEGAADPHRVAQKTPAAPVAQVR
jgi:outer membrane protein